MNGRENMVLWAALLAAIIFGAAVEWRAPRTSPQRLAALPAKGAWFSSSPLPLAPEERAFFGSAQVIRRVYRSGSGIFILVAVDGSANRHAVHDPLYCIRGSGWKLSEGTEVAIDGGTAELIRLSRNGEEREAVYWFSDGYGRHHSVVRYWTETTLRRLTFGRSGREPVMVILQSVGSDRPDWRALLDRCLFLYEF